MSVPNFHAFEVKYLGPTNFRGSRVKITTKRFEQSVFIPFDHAMNAIEDMAEKYLTQKGFKVIGQAEGLIITDTFKPIDETKWQKQLDDRYPTVEPYKSIHTK